MTLSFPLPLRRSSPLADLDPRWKLAGFFLAGLGSALLQQLEPAFVALFVAWGLALWGRIGVVWLGQRLVWVILVVGFFLLWLPWFPGPEDSIWHLGSLAVSMDGCRRAAVLLIRTLALVTLILVLWASTETADLLKAAQALRVPRLLVQITALTYRYLFLLVEEFLRLRVALRTRGFRSRMNRHSYRTIGHVAGSLLVHSYERAERIAQAMRCRGFDGRYRTVHDYQTRLADVILFNALILGAGALLLWDIMLAR